ncbi:hypothetical protein DFJ73DRAFT_817246 [Zopfochytrium polystomum]|nr:hypothetical protein DFJ73DRAFT_817246 [Zopfochytrium polystomum]
MSMSTVPRPGTSTNRTTTANATSIPGASPSTNLEILRQISILKSAISAKKAAATAVAARQQQYQRPPTAPPSSTWVNPSLTAASSASSSSQLHLPSTSATPSSLNLSRSFGPAPHLTASIPVAGPARPVFPTRSGRHLASKNRSLIVVKDATAAGSSGDEAAGDGKVGFVRSGNKLLRVGADGTVRSSPSRRLKRVRPESKPRVTAPASKSMKLVLVDGVPFKVDNQRRKLVRVDGTAAGGASVAKNTHSKGTSFIKTKSGKVVRRQSKKERNELKYCSFYRWGACSRGAKCHFIHDPARIAVCRPYLQGKCPHEPPSSCPLSHNPTERNMPLCVHLYQGAGLCRKFIPADSTQTGDNSSSNDWEGDQLRRPRGCPFLHVRLDPSAPVCRAFANEGYCALGAGCRHRHVFACPEYEASGTCPRGKECRLPHRGKDANGRVVRKGVEDRRGRGTSPTTESSSRSATREQDGGGRSSDEEEVLESMPLRPDFSLVPGMEYEVETSEDEEDAVGESDGSDDDAEVEQDPDPEEVEQEEHEEDGQEGEFGDYIEVDGVEDSEEEQHLWDSDVIALDVASDAE